MIAVSEETGSAHALKQTGLAVEAAHCVLMTHLTPLKSAVEACKISNELLSEFYALEKRARLTLRPLTVPTVSLESWQATASELSR